MSNLKLRTKVLTEVIVFSALSTVLYVFRPFSLPYGGSITLASMVPVMWLSLRRGVYVGSIAGAIFGVLALIVDVTILPFSPIVTPLQAILEYPVAFAALGFVGVFHRPSLIFSTVGVALGVFMKFLIHYFVGVFIWSSIYDFPQEWGLFLWPAVYNGSFLLIEFIISVILLIILIKNGTLEYAF